MIESQRIEVRRIDNEWRWFLLDEREHLLDFSADGFDTRSGAIGEAQKRYGFKFSVDVVE